LVRPAAGQVLRIRLAARVALPDGEALVTGVAAAMIPRLLHRRADAAARGRFGERSGYTALCIAVRSVANLVLTANSRT
jgi:hypothetical protein